MSNPLRVAVCLSGHMRSFQEASKTIFAHLAAPGLKDDVYAEYHIHTWFDRGPGHGAWDTAGRVSPSEIFDVYAPTSLCIEEHNPESWPARSMFRKIKLAHRSAVESRREYDIYVRARPDSFFVADVPLNEVVADNVVYLPHGADFGGVCDQFAMGRKSAMDHYSSLIDGVAADNHFHPETCLKDHLSKAVQVEKLAIYFKIMRSNGLLYNTMSI